MVLKDGEKHSTELNEEKEVIKHYLRVKPIDPITEKDEWDSVMGEDPNNEGEQGLKDIKSVAEGEDRDGKKYTEY